jgi:hypothetical protein
MKFRVLAPPLKKTEGGMRLRPLWELKYYVKPEGGWEALGVEFKSSREFVEWICSRLDSIEPDRIRTYRQWVLYCYYIHATPVYRWYIRATPAGLYKIKEPWKQVKLARSRCGGEPVPYRLDEPLKDPQQIADTLCRHINAGLAAPCDSRSASYFVHWILYCRRFSKTPNASSSLSASSNDFAK